MKTWYRSRVTTMAAFTMFAVASGVGQQSAQAQPAAQPAQDTAAAVVAPTTSQKLEADAAHEKPNEYNGRVNVDREVPMYAPKCMGPISFCNLYFGSGR